MSRFLYDEGGRYDAGFEDPAKRGDCLPRAVTISSGRPYAEIHASLSKIALHGDADMGVPSDDRFVQWMRDNGYEECVEVTDGAGYDDPRFQKGSYLMLIVIPGMVVEGIPAGHAFAMVDGVAKDTHDYRSHSKLYAYWRLKEDALQKAA